MTVSRSSDAAALAAIHASAFADAWSQDAIAALLQTGFAFIAEPARGFVLARVAANEAEILTLAVMPSARRSGLGRALVKGAAAHAASLGADTMFLEVAASNLAAIALYEGLGFAPAGRRKAYYGTEDALILKAGLPLSRGQDFA